MIVIPMGLTFVAMLFADGPADLIFYFAVFLHLATHK
jgi:hypothetical protein